MKDVLVLRSLEQLKAAADPLRQRILEALCAKPMTTKQVAQRLNEQPTKLYHHVEILERAGLLRLVETKRNRGTVEKYYEAVAEDYAVDHKLFAVRPQAEEALQATQDLFASILEMTLLEMRRSLAARLIDPQTHNQQAHLSRATIRASQAQIDRLRAKMQKILEECETLDRETGEVTYALTIAFYPVLPRPKEKKSKKKQ